MELLTANSGSYPRVGDRSGQMRLRRAYRKWEEGKLSDEELEGIYRGYTREVIHEQERAGLDVATDGQLRWYDPLSHFARNIDGCEIAGLLRYFDTNFYFRQPVIVGDLGRPEPLIVEEFLSAKEEASATLRPVVTGPHTLAKYSIDRHYGDPSELTMSFADVIAAEVEDLAEAGAGEIQIDEPAILGDRGDFEILSEAVEKLAGRKRGSQLGLHVYFGDSAPLYSELQDLPVDFLGLDFTYSPELPDLIEEEGSEKPLGLGLIDARNTRMEDPGRIVPLLERMVPEVDAGRVYLNPSCGIEFLPRGRAFEKLRNMVEIAEEAEEILEVS